MLKMTKTANQDCRMLLFPFIWFIINVKSALTLSPTQSIIFAKEETQQAKSLILYPTLDPISVETIYLLQNNQDGELDYSLKDNCSSEDCRISIDSSERQKVDKDSYGSAYTLTTRCNCSARGQVISGLPDNGSLQNRNGILASTSLIQQPSKGDVVYEIDALEDIASHKLSRLQHYDRIMRERSPNSDFVYTHTTRHKGFVNHSNTSKSDFDSRNGSKMNAGTGISNQKRTSWKQGNKNSANFYDVFGMCQAEPTLISPHPDNCAWYVNCSNTPDAAMMTFFNGYALECPYPQLFSEVTLQCEDFKDVQCNARFEPKSPCDYRANRCHESSHCVPCWVRYASCRGLNEGLNPWEGMEWEPFFVECHKERTVFQGLCDSSAVFSPITRACETPMSIPSKHGGWKPGCHGRLDGFYPDELGRCDLYYVCRGQLFRGFHSCQNGLKFNPFTSTCEPARQVPFPCGDKDDDTGLCKRKSDGFYLDVFGRCTHYFGCQNKTMTGFHVCSKGVFNYEKRRCDASEGVRSELAVPCGDLENICFQRADGVYKDIVVDRYNCRRRVVCERGLIIASQVSCSDPFE